MVKKNSVRAILELVFASTLWGFGFIAAVWAMEAVDAFELTLLRFAMASAVGMALLYFNIRKLPVRDLWRWSFWPAVFLTGTLVFQTWGLRYTTATKCGFITTLYVVFVPLLESWHRGRPVSWKLWACVAGAFLGTLMIVNVGLNGLNFGDFLTFICALFASAQIYYVGLISPRIQHPFAFNTFQSLWSALICVPFFFHNGMASKLAGWLDWPTTAMVGVFSLAFGSTVLAFALQIKAQAKLSPTVASLLCLLESPFAMIFAMALLGESLGPLEAAGAAVIFFSAVGASWIESTGKSGQNKA